MISALMSVYNGERYIQETICSILNQTYKDFELIIVDDSSTDNTLKIISDFHDERIRIIELNSNHGVGFALAEGVSACNYKYVAKVDADDLYVEDRFEKQLSFLETHNDIDILGSTVTYFADDDDVLNSSRFQSIKRNEPTHNSVINHEDISKIIYTLKPFPHPTYMMKTALLKQYNYNPIRTSEDYDLFFRLFKDGYRFHKLDEPLTKVRISNHSVNTSELQTYEQKLSLFENKLLTRMSSCKEFFAKGNFYIWGAGRNGYLCYDVLIKHNFEIGGFIDTYKYGQKDIKQDKIIISPQEAININPIIYIASVSGAIDIINFLTAHGFEPLYNFI